MLSKRYQHLVGDALLDRYKTKSLGDLSSGQMEHLLEGIYNDLCEGLTTCESAMKDAIMYDSISTKLNTYRFLEQNPNLIPSNHQHMTDEELTSVALSFKYHKCQDFPHPLARQ